jgi:hypothetical protein
MSFHTATYELLFSNWMCRRVPVETAIICRPLSCAAGGKGHPGLPIGEAGRTRGELGLKLIDVNDLRGKHSMGTFPRRRLVTVRCFRRILQKSIRLNVGSDTNLFMLQE